MKIATMIRMVVVAAIATAAVACAKGLNDQENPKIPEGMGELTLNQVRLDDTSPQGAAQRASRATVSALPQGATLRLYAFKTGAVDFTQLITSRTYTVDAAGTPILDAGQERLYLPLGAVEVYLVGPVQHNIGTTQAPDMVDVAAPFSISPRQGADLIADYNTATIVAGKVNPLPAMVLEHKMARVQVVVEQHELGAYENMVVKSVKLYGQPTEGTYTLNPDGGVITAKSTPATDVAFAQITEEEAQKRYSITTVLLPQAEREMKIETTFSCNQQNIDVGDNHPTVQYRQSGLITAELPAGTATQFSTKPLTPIEIKWRAKVLPWNAMTQETIVVPGVEQGLKNPPTADQYVEINGVRWTTGNLIAVNENECKVGAPADGGLYFQFGSLIGYKGGATANGGTGVGSNPYTGSGKYWGGASSWSWSNDAMVWPTAMTSTPTAWSPNAAQATEADAFKKWYFDFSGTSQNGSINYSTKESDIRSYTHPTLGALKEGKMALLGIGDPCTYYLGDPWRTPTAAEYLTLLGADGANTNKALPLKVNNYDLFFPASGYRYYSSGSFYNVTTYGYCWSSSVNSATHGYALYFYQPNGVIPQASNGRSNGFPVRCVSGQYTPPNPVNPPTASDYVEIDGLKWAKGSLVASSSTAGNTNGCKVGAPTDGGLYFQFGSLIGWKGGATANNGTGVGANPNRGSSTEWWGGATSWSWSNDAMVWPARMAGTPSSWPQPTSGTAHEWYFSGQGATSGEINVNDPTKGVGDPCTYYLGDPWRTPTAAEYTLLCNNNGVVNTQYSWSAVGGSWVDSGVKGGNLSGTQLFFPASGGRSQSKGSFYGVTASGTYWSSSVYSTTSSLNLRFVSDWVYPQYLLNRSYGFPVRCVSGTYVPPSNPVNPPTASDYVEIDGLKWTKGNLVASSSTAGNINGCKVGAPEDGGLYFQFGSLIGWKGGATANNGTGVGANPNTAMDTQWWGGAGNPGANIFGNDAMVWPTAMASTPAVWSPKAAQATEANAFKKWHFDFSGTSQNGLINYSTDGSDIRSYTHPTLGALKEGKMASLGIGDPCTYYLGDPWRLPTVAEYKTLFDNVGSGTGWESVTNWSWVTSPYNGAQRTGNNLFFPASGYRVDSNGSFGSVTTQGYYWSSSVYSATTGNPLNVHESAAVIPRYGSDRSYGFPVRCVAK